MLLIDFSQVMISNLFIDASFSNKKIEFSENLFRHKVLNSLRSYNVKFHGRFGDLVICCDCYGDYWRKKFFPYYKANRKKDRDNSGLDWDAIFVTLHKIKDELKENFPYQVLEIPSAEADDIIGTLAMKYHLREKILILSGDHDFVQLQTFKNIEQYAPIQKHFVESKTPARDLRIQIMKGDRGDGIPNFLSKDDVFVTDRRQMPLSTKKVEQWADMPTENFCTQEMLRNFKRNETLIDLKLIPKDLKEKIINEFEKPFERDRSKILNYLISHRCKMLIESIGEF